MFLSKHVSSASYKKTTCSFTPFSNSHAWCSLISLVPFLYSYNQVKTPLCINYIASLAIMCFNSIDLLVRGKRILHQSLQLEETARLLLDKLLDLYFSQFQTQLFSLCSCCLPSTYSTILNLTHAFFFVVTNTLCNTQICALAKYLA